jgi:hypothetical protein
LAAPVPTAADSSLPPTGAAPAGLLIVPGVRAGPILLDMPQKEVRKLLGEPDEVSHFDGYYYQSYFKRGVSLRFDRDRVTTIFLYSSVVGGYERPVWTRYGGATADGISPRSTREEVLAHYGKPDRSGDLQYAPIPSDWVYYDRLGMQFSFLIATGRQIMMSISKGSLPAAK